MGAGSGFAIGSSFKFCDDFEDLIHLSCIEDRVAVVFDPRAQTSVDHVGGHRGFKGRVPHEVDDGAKRGFGQCEEFHERADVKMVLVKGILKTAFLSIDLLRPLALFCITEDPAFIVFRFDHENSEWGYDDVVDLGASFAVGAR